MLQTGQDGKSSIINQGIVGLQTSLIDQSRESTIEALKDTYVWGIDQLYFSIQKFRNFSKKNDTLNVLINNQKIL